jgi:hypothetical protein
MGQLGILTSLGIYCAKTLMAALAVATVGTLAGSGLTALFPSVSILAMAGKIGTWVLVAVVPFVFVTLPDHWRAAVLGRVTRTFARRPGSRRDKRT